MVVTGVWGKGKSWERKNPTGTSDAVACGEGSPDINSRSPRGTSHDPRAHPYR